MRFHCQASSLRPFSNLRTSGVASVTRALQVAPKKPEEFSPPGSLNGLEILVFERDLVRGPLTSLPMGVDVYPPVKLLRSC